MAKTKKNAKGKHNRKRSTRRLRFPLRVRLSVVAALAFAAVVLATSMPVEALLGQHRQLDSTAAALSQAQAADRSLSAQLKAMSDPATVDDLARADYGLVAPGQKAYVILPTGGASGAAVTGSGHVALDEPPVVPGSAQSRQALGLASLSAGAGAQPTTSPPSASSSAVRRSPAPPSSDDPGGFWTRVVRTLEFWR